MIFVSFELIKMSQRIFIKYSFLNITVIKMLKNSQTCNNLIHVFACFFIAVRYIITILYRVKSIEVLTLIIIRILKLFYQIIIKSKNLIHIFAIAKGKSKMKLKKQLAYRRKNIL